jgi:hypothetical protein
VIEVQPSSNILTRQILSSDARTPFTPVETSYSMGRLTEDGSLQGLCPKANAKAKSITEGLAKIDEQISDPKLQDADQFLEEEDKYGHCGFCDKEILVNPFNVSEGGMYFCDDCYSSTGGKE